MILRLLTPVKELLNVETVKVTLPGRTGEMTILPGHTKLLARLKKGRIKYTSGGGGEVYEINGGLLEVVDDVLTVLMS